jgi:RNA polymerase sigma-70 factor (ECF subfamily)
MSSNPERLLTVVSNDHADQAMQFKAAVESYQAELYAFAYRILGGRGDAEDALQNAFLKAFRTVQAGDLPASLSRPWLYRVVYNCCIDELRRTARTSHDVLDEGAAALPAPHQRHSTARAISAALLALPTSSRATVLLVDIHGFSYDEAAAALDVPRGTIASRLNHGRNALRQALTDAELSTGGIR